MADIFLSYAREDRRTASSFADAFAEHGWSVFWDRDIPTGRPFDRVIEHELGVAKCAIVLWSEHSVGSNWVRSEARAASRREVLHPVLIDEVGIPLEFSGLQAANLIGWQRGAQSDEYDRLLADLSVAITGRPRPGVDPPRLPPRKRSSHQYGKWLPSSVAVVVLLGAIGAAFLLRGLREETVSSSAPTSSAGPTTSAVSPPPAPGPAFPAKADAPVAGGESRDQGGLAKPDPQPIGDVAPPRPEAPAPVPESVPDEASVRLAIEAYEDAFTSGSREAVRRVFPGVSDGELREVASLRDNFGNARYSMSIIVSRIRIASGAGGVPQATVDCRIFHNGLDDSGKPLRRDRAETLRFEWTGSTWVRIR